MQRMPLHSSGAGYFSAIKQINVASGSDQYYFRRSNFIDQ